MPSERYLSLIRVGPAKGLDSSTCPEDVAPGDGAVVSNVATRRALGGLSTELGRSNITTFSNFSNYRASAIVMYAASATDEQYIVSFVRPGYASAVVVYDPAVAIQPVAGLSNGLGFTQAIQFYNTVYTNSGQQYSVLNPGAMYLWQYPAPNGVSQAYSVSTGSGSLPAGTYYYAFTWVVQGPNGAFLQETTPTGALPTVGPPPPATLYPYTVTSANTSSAVITGTFAGTTADGASYTTNLYRLSTNTDVWYLVANLTTNTTYTDNANDSQLQSNQQLLQYQDPPPVSGTNQGVIFIHQERVFCFVQVQDADTNNQPQTQLWWSDLGTPSRFDSVDSVILVGNSATTANPQYFGYGDNPVAGISLGGTALLFKSRSCWLLFGETPVTYFVSNAFNIGCMAPRSAIYALGQAWWLSEDGIYTFSGAAPQYISAKVRETLDAIPFSDRQNCSAFMSKQCICFTFPATNITLVYYTVTGDWTTLPYAADAVSFVPANPVKYQGAFTAATGRVNEVVASRVGLPIIDNWFAAETDLGGPVTATWTTPLQTSGAPHIQKTYDYLTVVAPFQPGTLTATLNIDPNSPVETKQFSVTFDLSGTSYAQPETRHIARISPDLRGYIASLTLTYTNTTGQSDKLIIYRVDVWGTYDRTLAIPN